MNNQIVSDKGMDLLVEGIIKQAVDDYVKHAIDKYKIKCDMNKVSFCRQQDFKFKIANIEGKMEYIEKFFRSQWYQQLCGIDGEKMIKQAKRIAEERIEALKLKEIGGKE